MASTNSWDTYISNMRSGGCMYASINGLDGSLWSASEGFVVLPEECAKLIDAMENEMSALATAGFTVAGQHYTMTRGENGDDEGVPSFVMGRCKEEGKSTQGTVIFKTNQAIVVGVHDPAYSEGTTFGKVNTEIGRIADHMWESSF